MYTLIFESKFIEHVIAKHLQDIDQCETAMIYFCSDFNKLISNKKTWYDNFGRLVYDFGLDNEFFICVKEK